ncbi:MAG: ABC transporter substrate-binding protein [Terriglobia bacterium]
MRRGVPLAGTVLLALAALAPGCARPPRADAPVTLVFKHAKHPRYQFLNKLIREFQAQHPGIRVREEILPASTDEQHQFYVINLAAEAADFDVIDMDVIWVPEFARAGWLVELTSHLPPEELTPLNPAALRADWLQGKLFAVPWFVDVGVLYYRRDLLAKYGFGPPATYPELLAQARHILANEANDSLMGFVWQGMQYEGLVCTALEFIRGNGGDVLAPDAEVALTEPATLEALTFMRELIRPQGVTPALVTTLNEEATRLIFQSGRAVFMRNWPYAWGLLNQPDSPVAGRVGLTTVPHFPDHASAPTLGGFHLGVNAYSRHPKAAIKFVRFMISYRAQREIILNLGVLAAHRRVYRDPAVRAALPFLEDLLPSLARVQPRPVTPYYLMISQILQPELSAVVTGIRSPDAAMRLAKQQIEHLLEAR